MPGLLKIGMTLRSPEERAAELNSTSVAMPFNVAHKWPVPDQKTAYYEKIVHKKLDHYRKSKNREFFEISADLAFSIIDKLIPSEEQIRKQERQAVLERQQRESQRIFWENERKKENLKKLKLNYKNALEELKRLEIQIPEVVQREDSDSKSIGSKLMYLIFSPLFLFGYAMKYYWVTILVAGAWKYQNERDLISSVFFGLISPIALGVMLLLFIWLLFAAHTLLKNFLGIFGIYFSSRIELSSESLKERQERLKTDMKRYQLEIQALENSIE